MHFFVRTFHWTPAQIGGLYGPVVAGALAAVPLVLFAPLSGSPYLTLSLFGAANFIIAAAVGSGPRTFARSDPREHAGVTHALAVLTVNLIAIGLGPSSIALFTDFVLKDKHRVGVSLAIVTPVILAISGAVALAGRKPLLQAIERFKKL